MSLRTDIEQALLDLQASGADLDDATLTDLVNRFRQQVPVQPAGPETKAFNPEEARDRHGRWTRLGEVVRLLTGDAKDTTGVVTSGQGDRLQVRTAHGVVDVAAHDVEHASEADVPMPEGLRFRPAPGQRYARCRTGGELLPVTKFPTMGGGYRSTECRAHRDARRAGRQVPVPPVPEHGEDRPHVLAVERARAAVGDPATLGFRREHLSEHDLLTELQPKIERQIADRERWQAVLDGGRDPASGLRIGDVSPAGFRMTREDAQVFRDQAERTRAGLQARYDEGRDWLLSHGRYDEQGYTSVPDLARPDGQGYFGPGAETVRKARAMQDAGQALYDEMRRRTRDRIMAAVSPAVRARLLPWDEEQQARAADVPGPHGVYSPEASAASGRLLEHSDALAEVPAGVRQQAFAEARDEVLGEVTDLGGVEHRLYAGAGPSRPAADVKPGDLIWVDGGPRKVTAVRDVPTVVDTVGQAGGPKLMDVSLEGYPVAQRVRAVNDVAPPDPAHEQAIRYAESVYPRSWLQRSAERGDTARDGMLVQLAPEARGFYSDADGRGLIALSARTSRLPDRGEFDSVAVHEMGHRMEHSVPGVRAAEWVYYTQRTARLQPDGSWDLAATTPLGGGYRDNEVTRADLFIDRYSGKAYSGQPSWLADYELLTMAQQTLFTGDAFADPEMQAWALGVLTSLSDPPAEHVEPEVERPAHVAAVEAARAALPADPKDLVPPRQPVESYGGIRDVDAALAQWGHADPRVARAYARKQYRDTYGKAPPTAADLEVFRQANIDALQQHRTEVLANLRSRSTYDPATDTVETASVDPNVVPEQTRAHLATVKQAGQALAQEIDRRLATSTAQARVETAEAERDAANTRYRDVNARFRARRDEVADAELDRQGITDPADRAYLRGEGYPHTAPNALHGDEAVYATAVRYGGHELGSPGAEDEQYRVLPMSAYGRLSRAERLVSGRDLVALDRQTSLDRLAAMKDRVLLVRHAIRQAQREALDSLSRESNTAAQRHLEALREARAARTAALREARDVTLAVLSDTREFGGVQPRLRGRGRPVAAARAAERYLPADWLRSVDRGGALDVREVKRRGNWESGIMRLSPGGGIGDDPTLTRCAVHEYGHAVEDRHPGVTELEWAFHVDRTTHGDVRDPLTRMPGYSAREKARADDYLDAYTGKQYRNGGPSSNHEVLTTALESLFAGSPYIASRTAGRRDDDLRHFTLGLLATV